MGSAAAACSAGWDPQKEALNTQHEALNTQHEALNTQHEALNTPKHSHNKAVNTQTHPTNQTLTKPPKLNPEPQTRNPQNAALNTQTEHSRWEICSSAGQAAALGLTAEICNSVDNADLYVTQQSGPGGYDCGDLNVDDLWGGAPGVNDIWGCGGAAGCAPAAFLLPLL